MNKVILLDTLKEFTEQAIKDLIMPVMRQKNDTNEEAAPRPARVYKMSLPDMKLKDKKAPYIIHQIITGKDEQLTGEREQAETLVRTVFAVYSPDEQEGGLALLNLMERMRIALMQQVVIGKQFKLDLSAGLETLVYPDDTAPYYIGEVVSTWELPGITRKVD